MGDFADMAVDQAMDAIISGEAEYDDYECDYEGGFSFRRYKAYTKKEKQEFAKMRAKWKQEELYSRIRRRLNRV